MEGLKQKLTEWELAKFLHDLYEEYAEHIGWKTQTECKVPFDNLPKKNKAVMIAVSVQVKKHIMALLVETEKTLQEKRDKLWEQIHNFSFDLQKETSRQILNSELNEWQLCIYLKGQLKSLDGLLLGDVK